MGAWGTGPLENDAALDFVDSLKRSRKSNRLVKAEAALRAYLEFDQRLQRGENISVLDEAGIDELRSSRASTLQWYTSIGEAPPVGLFPEIATEETWEAYVQQLSAPEIDDGSHEAFCAIAVSHIAAEAIAGQGAFSEFGRDSLTKLATLCSEVLSRILCNDPFRSSWQNDDYARFASAIEELNLRLRAEA